MPEFQKKVVKFKHSGIQWNRSIDTIPEGQICYGRNIRATQDETLTQRPGLTSYVTIGGGSSFVHSIATLNNFNTQLVAFSKVYVIGAATPAGPPDVNKLFVGDTAAHLTNGAINPVALPNGTTFNSSGNPLTYVDMAPVGTNIGWKYIGDAGMNVSVGYYPGDSTAGMARAITMGITPPVYTGIPAAGGVGDLTGSYQWIFAYRNKFTGARSNPSAPSRVTLATPALALTAQAATFTTPVTPNNPQTGAADANILVDIYRFGGTINDWRYVGTAPGNTAFTDNLPDSAIETSPTPPQVTDPTTGVTRFNLFRPFVVQANAVYSTTNGTITVNASGTYDLQANGADVFDVNWLPGSAISINNKIFTIFQVINQLHIELVEDGAGSIPAGNYAWATQTGTLTAGQPLPHIWGPYGTGSGGAFIFGCGGTNSDSGTLYWTNGNDPDSADVANSLVVTSPSEPLRGGCIYDGTAFVFSTERMFRIYPGTVAGQFTVQEVPGGKGLWAEYSLTVQSNAIADQSISWVGKDGIYDWTASGGLQSLTDRDLYPFFPHDNQAGQSLLSLFPSPFTNRAEPHPVNAPDFSASNMRYHRLCWYQGELFYDFPATGGAFHTLVFDSKQVHGWVSLDQYANGGGSAATVLPVARGIEIAASNMKVAVGPVILDYTGTTDGGTALPCRVVTRQDDLGDSRAQKLWGDYMFDASAGNSAGITLTPLLSYASTTGTAHTLTDATRFQNVFNVAATGLGILSLSFGFDATWTASSTAPTLYQYDVAYVPKPEFTAQRITDKTDDGYVGAKYLRGLCIESNTAGNTRSVDVLVDGVSVATLSVNTASQLELPFAITPIVGSEFQVSPTDSANLWQLFTVRWVWEKWPDLTVIQSNWMNLGTTKPKYIRSFSVPVSGPAAPTLSFTATYDGASTYATTPVAPASISAKSPAQFSFNPPILAHQIKLTPSTPCRVWYEEIAWDAEEWPELATFYGPVESLGSSGAKYLRGFELPIETNGGVVNMEIVYDRQPTSTTGTSVIEVFTGVSTTALSKNTFPFTPAVPLIAHHFQLFSNAPARFWYNEVKWDFEPWPEFDTGRSPWMDGGTIGAKYIRGFVIPVDTGGAPVTFDLVTETGQTVVIGPFLTTAGVKAPVPFAFTVPLIFHEFQITPRTNCRVWYEEIKWDFDPWPELETESSAWLNAGTPGAKFMQGLVIPMDTGGLAVTMDLVYDGGSIVVGPFTTPASRKTPVPFSFPVPFIAHEFQLTPRTPCRVWSEEIKWMWEPVPELVTTYTTQATDHDLPGYSYLFDCYIAYIGSGDAPLFTVTTEYGSISYALPVSNGVFTRAYLMLNPQKAKWRSYSITSTGGIRLFLKDCEVRLKNWTDKGNYPSAFQSHRPFGDDSRESGARI